MLQIKKQPNRNNISGSINEKCGRWPCPVLVTTLCNSMQNKGPPLFIKGVCSLRGI